MKDLDVHVREIVHWHFSERTGTPLWLDWARDTGFDYRRIRLFDDLHLLPRFEDGWLRAMPHERLIPRAYADRPFMVFETGGTTGTPKQRLSWEDHRLDYEVFSEHLSDAAFPRGGAWLMLGPTGPRRLRLSIEHLAQHRGGVCYHVDCDPRWARRLAIDGRHAEAAAYTAHVAEQGARLLSSRAVQCLFTTPALLEALGDRVDLRASGIRGVFCGGTSMSAQTLRFLCEEVLGEDIALVPTYGNTLMGLAIGLPVNATRGYEPAYYAPQPRAVLRVVDPEDPDQLVDHGARGQVELTTLTQELLLPRHLERDEAIRLPPCSRFPFDGVGDVRPLGAGQGQGAVEGVY